MAPHDAGAARHRRDPAARRPQGAARCLAAGAVALATAFLAACAGTGTPPAAAPGSIGIGPAPAPPPAAWRAYLGAYGGDGLPDLLVREADGRLEVLVNADWTYTLEPRDGDRFALVAPPEASGAPIPAAARTARFVRSGDRATGMAMGGLLFQRRSLGPSDGGTFRIRPLRPVAELRGEAMAASPPAELTRAERQPDLVEPASMDTNIRLDIRYATTNNFMGAPFYAEARAFMQRPAAEALVRASRRLQAYGYGVLIHDAYRPWYVTKMFWDATPEAQRDFVANPEHGSRHNRGCAVDLTLYDLATGEPVSMPSGYDEFTERAYPDFPGGTSLQRWHRMLLRKAMEAEGFEVYRYEWWHFDYRDWDRYPVMNLRFDAIRSP